MQQRFTQAQFQDLIANIDTCNLLFPRAFPKRISGLPVYPLKVGIGKELHAALVAAGNEISMIAVRRLLSHWCSRAFYLKSFKHAVHRIDLNGEPAGEITGLQRSIARKTLTDRSSRLEAKIETDIEGIQVSAQEAI